ncbi:MAG: DegV family protein [Butyrivibrio sp.]|nr:DegV family protein [Butyrivibrio sp.]
MSFTVFADGCANLPQSKAKEIVILPCDYLVNDTNVVYSGDIDNFDGHTYYDSLRNGVNIKTSLLNTQLFLNYFTPYASEGKDIIYISMSSGISGTYNAAIAAANELMENYPDCFIHIVDSHGCGFGNGILALRAAELNRQGIDTKEAARILDDAVPHACQYFTVDDLNFLKRTGRVSGVTANIGTILNIKPILFGDSTGHIISCSKVRGRKSAINSLASKYAEKRMESENAVFISHGDCIDDANALAELIKGVNPDADITICMHEPFSGAHVGPGMLGLFFWGVER